MQERDGKGRWGGVVIQLKKGKGSRGEIRGKKVKESVGELIRLEGTKGKNDSLVNLD